MLRVLIFEEDLSILNVYIPDYRASKHMKQKWTTSRIRQTQLLKIPKSLSQ